MIFARLVCYGLFLWSLFWVALWHEVSIEGTSAEASERFFAFPAEAYYVTLVLMAVTIGIMESVARKRKDH